MKTKQKPISSMFFRMNYEVYIIMTVVYALKGLYILFGYALFSVILASIFYLCRPKIKRSFLLCYYFLNADILILLFTITVKYSAGSELYLLMLAGGCFLFVYEYEKSTLVCTLYSVLSLLIYFYIELFFNTRYLDQLPFSQTFYLVHFIFSLVVSFGGFVTTSVAYGRELSEKTNKQREQEFRLVYEANHDMLTNLINRRRMWEHLRLAQTAKQEKNVEYHISIFDIDNFKKTNDTFGHACGDYVLSELATIIKKSMLRNSKIARWGGEEFLLLYCGFSDEDILIDLERIRLLVQDHEFVFNENIIPITITLGVSSSKQKANAEQVIIEADKQLMKGKISGKNKVVALGLNTKEDSDYSILDTFMEPSSITSEQK